MRRSAAALIITFALVMGVALPDPASAVFIDVASPSAGMSAGTDALAEPTGLAVAHGTCSTVTGDVVTLTWLASTSTWADGYDVLRSIVSGGPFVQVAHVNAGTLAYTDTSLAASTTYYYRVRATKSNWTSSELSTAVITTRNVLCL